MSKADMINLTLKALDFDREEIDRLLQRSRACYKRTGSREWEIFTTAFELLQAVNNGDVHIEYIYNSIENTFMKDSYN